MRLFYLFRIWLLLLEELQAVKEPHTRKNGILGVNKPLVKIDYTYSQQDDERGYDHRYSIKNVDGDTHSFADKIIKLAQLKELQSLSRKLATHTHRNMTPPPEHTNVYIEHLNERITGAKSVGEGRCFLNIMEENERITPEYLDACMRHIDENIYMNCKTAIGESSVLREMSRFSSFNTDKSPTSCPQDGVLSHFSNKIPPIEPLNTRHSSYSVRNLKKGGLLDDFNREI